MSYYQYAKRGNNCFPNTCALTSNEKFLPLMDPVYYLKYTQTQQYPGQSTDFVKRTHNVQSPEDIKFTNYGHPEQSNVKPSGKSCNCPSVY